MSDSPFKVFRESQTPALSQGQLAQQLGVSRVSVTRWEKGTRQPDRKLLQKIAAKTGLSPSQLRPDLAAELMDPAE